MVDFPSLLTGNFLFKKAWNGLVRRIQTTVEHMRVTNTEQTAMARGHVLGLVAGQRQAELAAVNGNYEWCAVACEPIAAGEKGIARISGYAYCLFEDQLAPATGDEAFLSTTAGLLTTQDTGCKVGVIGDDTIYATEGACYVFMNHCCTRGRIG
jgi:hypothetical protein